MNYAQLQTSPITSRRYYFAFFILSISIIFSSCGEDIGSFSVTLNWTIDEPEPNTFVMEGLIRYPGGGILTTSPARIVYRGPETEINFPPPLANENLSIEISFFPLDSTDIRPVYFGRSDTFSLEEGAHHVISIDIVEAPQLP